MESKITQVSLVVANKARSLDFFTEKVGFEKKADVTSPAGYRWVTVGPKGQELELVLWEMGSTVDADQTARAARWAPAAAPPTILRVADCRKAYEELRARGVVFPQPPMEHPWGVVATFEDLDGNLFSLSQLRGWQASK
jgi:predicted enzyme related to lactoylglutathione lyase